MTFCVTPPPSAELPDDQIDKLLRALDDDQSGTVNVTDIDHTKITQCDLKHKYNNL